VVLEAPVWQEAVSGDVPILQSARAYRTVCDAIWTSEGVIGAGDLLPSARAAGANMSVDIAAGLVVIQGDAIAAQGKYVMRSTAVTNLPINAAPATGSRTDLIVAQLYDKQADGGTTYGWSLLVLPSTTTRPPSSVEVGRVTVPAGATSIVAGNISNVNRQYAQTTAAVVTRPIYTLQASGPSFSTVGTFADFTSSQWAPLTVTFPPSGQIWVTISADMHNTNTSASTVATAWRYSGGSATIVGGGDQVLIGGTYSGQSRRSLVTAPSGTTLTLTPIYRISSGSASTADISNGSLFVEFVS
jgi:hypothetical protein